MSKPFYITTAISYPNGRPHIGHAYEAIATDAIARFQRLMGRTVRFQTGTDEHGLKMAQTARNKGIEPRALADEMSSFFKEMDDTLNISYDRFIRTSEPVHHAASQALWKAMEDSGDLYLDRYEGWYSVRDEAFYDEKELIEGEGGARLSPQGTPVEWTVEESWFFNLKKYQQPLLDLYAAQPDFIRPESRRNEILRFVEGGLSDLSVSRTSFDWGVKVPGSDGHVMYVWVDALTNYLTGLGYPDDSADFRTFWAEGGDIVHIIGKDIVRFHAVYWPAFLMSAKLPLPKQVFGHGFLLNRGEKMSKSVGNVADPLELANVFGVDQLRYFLLREISFGQDGSYSAEAIVTRSNADLANSFGNLVQRTLSFIFKNLDGKLPYPRPSDGMNDADRELLGRLELNLQQFQIEFNLLNLDRAIQNWMLSVFDANAFIDEQAPWKLRKENPERMGEVLATLCLVIRHLAIALQPIAPNGAENILDQLGIGQGPGARRAPLNEQGLWDVWSAEWYEQLVFSDFRLSAPTAVFPRLDLPTEE